MWLPMHMQKLSEQLERNRKENDEIVKEMITVVKRAKREGYTMVEIAERLGISRQTAYAYLRS